MMMIMMAALGAIDRHSATLDSLDARLGLVTNSAWFLAALGASYVPQLMYPDCRPRF